jgi:hypothetical protein
MLLVVGLSLTSILSGCVVEERGRCRYGWEPEHRDGYGRIVPGHCR